MDHSSIGYGTMQLTGDGVWGPPPDWRAAVGLLRAAYDYGVRVFDTAWYYGPEVTHRLLAEALWPYSDDLQLVTKAGNSRRADRSWEPALEPSQLRSACELDLRLLHLDQLPLVLLRWRPREADDSEFEQAISVLLGLQSEGKIRDLGISNVELRHLRLALTLTRVEAVSNSLSLTSQRDWNVLTECGSKGIAFLPYYPLLGGDVIRQPIVQYVARQLRVTPAQVALAWLRAQSPVVIPIPGTRSVRHLQENVEAQRLVLPDEHLVALRGVAGRVRG